MRLKGLNASRWECDTVSHPIQKDATSCGVYALKVCIPDFSWQNHVIMLHKICCIEASMIKTYWDSKRKADI